MLGFNHIEDVSYGHKDGMALVMDVYVPEEGRLDAGIILAISGGWSTDRSRRQDLLQEPEGWGVLPKCLLDAGYVIFAAAHSTQPRYTIDELRPDLPRAVRYIRHHARSFGIGPHKLGIVGGSSGGHVSLMTALAPPPPDATAPDPIDRESSEVQAVAAYFPPTDLLNYGVPGVTMLDSHGASRAAPLDFRRFDEESGRYERITDSSELEDCFRRNSPIAHVASGNPPVLLIHGDGDDLVPVSQSEVLRDRLQASGVPNELVVLAGHGHAWPPPGHGQREVVEWFNRYLRPVRR